MPERKDVPLLDLAPLHEPLHAEIDAAIRRVLDSQRFVLGDALVEFERHAAAYLGSHHAIGVGNGTDALQLTLESAGIQPGDEIILPAFTFFATAEAVLHVGAIPVFADIDPATLTLDAGDVEARVTPRTGALLPVHLFGLPADMSALLRLARAHDLVVIEDAAQAFGTTRNGQSAGTFGLAGCFSFHPSKPLGALGDGGLVVTDNDDLAARVRRLRNHGTIAQHRHADVGRNSRLDELQAAVLDVKLRHFDAHLAERTRLARRYMALLDGLPLQLPAEAPGYRQTFAQFTICTSERERVKENLAATGIASAVHYPLPVYRQPALANHLDADVQLPVTEASCRQCLSLPLYEGLTETQQQRIADVIRETLE